MKINKVNSISKYKAIIKEENIKNSLYTIEGEYVNNKFFISILILILYNNLEFYFI